MLMRPEDVPTGSTGSSQSSQSMEMSFVFVAHWKSCWALAHWLRGEEMSCTLERDDCTPAHATRRRNGIIKAGMIVLYIRAWERSHLI